MGDRPPSTTSDSPELDLTEDEKKLLSSVTLCARPNELTSAEEAQETTLGVQEHIARFAAELSKLELPRTEIEFRIKEEKVRVARELLESAKFGQREVTIYWGGENFSDCENIMLEKTTDLLVASKLDAWTVCRQVACKNGLEMDKPWGLVIYDSAQSILRGVEDHEVVLDILDSWKTRKLLSRQLFFRSEPKKYHMFESPSAYFNSLTDCLDPSWTRVEKKLAVSRRFLTEYYRSTPAKVPALTEELYVRIGTKKWKKVTCSITEDGVFYEKPKEKNPVCYVSFSHTKFFETVNYDRLFKAPFAAVIAVDEDDSKEDYLKAICFEDRFKHVTWYMALRMGSFSSQLLDNLELNQRRMKMLENLKRHGASFVAQAGRRASNLVQKASVISINLQSSSDFHLDWSHRNADWFHGKVSRAQQQTCLEQLGGKDGLYLIRESSTQEGQLVLAVCSRGAVLNFLITEEEGGYVVAESKPHRTIQLLLDTLEQKQHALPCRLKEHAPKILSIVLFNLTVDKVTEE